MIFLDYVSDVFEQQRLKLDPLSRDTATDLYIPTEEARQSRRGNRDEC
ncbi:hypothetical protein [Microcella alkalica]|nr:hypothetical protein [Microcella alkalica]